MIEQITYLLFVRGLDDIQTREENSRRRVTILHSTLRHYSTHLIIDRRSEVPKPLKSPEVLFLRQQDAESTAFVPNAWLAV
ncbi:hypothetical protein QA646_16295 [Rhizobium sp. CB3090]|uniref:hypothetical protein n=1 Tax=Rhizobium sp. CB3090 TaxID=3039156 RepID=UPI0024B0F456|nr:hypothetical protein [Rhizobium sp. CB3090]WFU08834.1 hypothetical protein QA646_16295 [Rhizobium sp. CB3090]